MDPNADLAARIVRQLALIQPQRLLALGATAAAAAAAYRARAPETDLQAVEPPYLERLAAVQPTDLAVVADALETLDRAAAAILLGQLRDLYAHRILASLRPGAAWQHRDMIAHGFVRVEETDSPAGPPLYEFNIATYKTTPDWLNSKHWANPRLFDKYRW